MRRCVLDVLFCCCCCLYIYARCAACIEYVRKLAQSNHHLQIYNKKVSLCGVSLKNVVDSTAASLHLNYNINCMRVCVCVCARLMMKIMNKEKENACKTERERELNRNRCFSLFPLCDYMYIKRERTDEKLNFK